MRVLLAIVAVSFLLVPAACGHREAFYEARDLTQALAHATESRGLVVADFTIAN